jgi:hypothetical protein
MANHSPVAAEVVELGSFGQPGRNTLGMISDLLINTPLQRGGGRIGSDGNRFSGFRGCGQTVETVSSLTECPVTPLKRGVNENARKHWRFDRIQHCQNSFHF